MRVQLVLQPLEFCLCTFLLLLLQLLLNDHRTAHMVHQQGNPGKESTHEDGDKRRGVEADEGILTVALVRDVACELRWVEVVKKEIRQSCKDHGIASPEHPTAVAIITPGHEDEGIDEVDGGRRPVDSGIDIESPHGSRPTLRGDECRDGRHHQECQPPCYLQPVERDVLSRDSYFHAAKLYINSETTKFLN